MSPKDAIDWYESHIVRCPHRLSRRPCHHEVVIECAVCGNPYTELGVFLSMKHPTTCDSCVREQG